MSLVFSDTTNKDGIIQTLERTLFGDSGDARISGNTTQLAYFTGDINLALDKALTIIFRAGGTWQFDDANHTDYPIITTDLVASQRDYSFTEDGNSNLILDIYKVFVANADGVYNEVHPVDVQSESNTQPFTDGQNAEGTPYRYDKTGNGIFLDPIPDYAETAGLKIYINREGSYFTTADTTKKPGIAGLFHEYLVLRPAYQYAYRNGLSNAGVLQDEMLRMEDAMRKYYGRRERDVRNTLKGRVTEFR